MFSLLNFVDRSLGPVSAYRRWRGGLWLWRRKDAPLGWTRMRSCQRKAYRLVLDGFGIVEEYGR